MKLNSNARIIFITHTNNPKNPFMDPSVRYRCYNMAECLTKKGYIVDVSADASFTPAMFENYDVFIFHRPHVNAAENIASLMESDKILIADYDDLIFATQYAKESSLYLNGTVPGDKVLEIFDDNFKMFSMFKNFTVSTTALKQIVEQLVPDAECSVIHNGLSPSFLEYWRALYHPQTVNVVPVISYMSGTASHEKDFLSIASTLDKFLEKYPRYRLNVFGVLKSVSEMSRQLQIARIGHMPYYAFIQKLSSARLNIAPLVSDNIFNQCKSGLKFFESGIWGIPTIATPNPDFERFKDSPAMFLPETPEQWMDCLEKLADNDFYHESTKGIVEYCCSNCLAMTSAHKLTKFLDGLK